ALARGEGAGWLARNAPPPGALSLRAWQALPAHGQARVSAGAPHHCHHDVPRDGDDVLAGEGRDGRITRERLLAVTVVLTALVGCAGQAPRVPRARHVLIVSIDGLRPEFYLDEAWAAPELRALLKAGSYARAAEGVFPTVTYPNHASIVTGVRPARHGVFSNTIPTP